MRYANHTYGRKEVALFLPFPVPMPRSPGVSSSSSSLGRLHCDPSVLFCLSLASLSPLSSFCSCPCLAGGFTPMLVMTLLAAAIAAAAVEGSDSCIVDSVDTGEGLLEI